MKDFLAVTISLIGVLGLILLLFYGVRLLNKRVSVVGGSRLHVLDRANIGRESMLLVVSVCGKLMLIGVSSQRVEKLADLDVSEEEYARAIKEDGNIPIFSDVLGRFLGGKKDKGGDSEKGSEDNRLENK
ncbi:MAG: flagellar biosynthetic protein FliO [Oscillospiraceae bacterium]|nr:flagellar biosynthetic protein FliO [Oscillospiraceae bacterium]